MAYTKKEFNLAELLAPNFWNCTEYGKEVFLKWAREIIKTKKNPYHGVTCALNHYKYKEKHTNICNPIRLFLI